MVRKGRLITAGLVLAVSWFGAVGHLRGSATRKLLKQNGYVATAMRNREEGREKIAEIYDIHARKSGEAARNYRNIYRNIGGEAVFGPPLCFSRE